MQYIITCEECGEQLRYRHWTERWSDGWLELVTNEDENGLDFCSVACLIAYHTNNSEEV